MSHSQKKFIFIFVLLFITALTGWLYWRSAAQASNHVFISEVSFSNNEKQDWVELYNPSQHNLSLKHFYLSDDVEDPTRFQIPFELVIPAHSTVTLYGKKAKYIPPGAVRLSFNMGSGETIVLSTPVGKQLDKLALVAPPGFKGKFTLGRNSLDATKTEVIFQPSPLAVNKGLL